MIITFLAFNLFGAAASAVSPAAINLLEEVMAIEEVTESLTRPLIPTEPVQELDADELADLVYLIASSAESTTPAPTLLKAFETLKQYAAEGLLSEELSQMYFYALQTGILSDNPTIRKQSQLHFKEIIDRAIEVIKTHPAASIPGGWPSKLEIDHARNEISSLMAIRESTPRHEELRDLEEGAPKQRFTNAHLAVFIEFLAKHPNLESNLIQALAIGNTALQILMTYEKAGFLTQELRHAYLLTIRSIATEVDEHSLRKESLLVLKGIVHRTAVRVQLRESLTALKGLTDVAHRTAVRVPSPHGVQTDSCYNPLTTMGRRVHQDEREGF